MLSMNTWYRPYPFPRIDKELNDILSPLFESVHQYNEQTRVVDNVLEWSVDMPGIKVDDIDVQTSGRTLTVSATRGKRSYKFSYRVPMEYAPDSASAMLEDGVLIVKFTKLPELEPRKIKVRLL